MNCAIVGVVVVPEGGGGLVVRTGVILAGARDNEVQGMAVDGDGKVPAEMDSVHRIVVEKASRGDLRHPF